MRSPRLIASASPELAIGVIGVGPPFGVSLDLGRRLESGWFSALSFIDKRTDSGRAAGDQLPEVKTSWVSSTPSRTVNSKPEPRYHPQRPCAERELRRENRKRDLTNSRS